MRNIFGYYYDVRGQLTSVEYPTNRLVQIGWNVLGQPTRLYDTTGAVALHYNHQGLLSAVSNSFGVWQERTFDVLDRPTNLVLASGVRHALTYDNLGRLLSRTDVTVGGRERFAYMLRTLLTS